MSKGVSAWEGILVVDAHAPVSVCWDGIPVVDAHGPVELELANHCRQPETFKLWEKTHRWSAWRGLGSPRDPTTPIAIDPVQHR